MCLTFVATLDILKKFSSEIVSSISDDILFASSLHSAALISFNQKSELLTSFFANNTKSSLLFNIVDRNFKTDILPENRAEKLEVFCEVLREQGIMASRLADKMISDLRNVTEGEGMLCVKCISQSIVYIAKYNVCLKSIDYFIKGL